MIKKHLKILITTSVTILLPILAGVILWGKLPDKLPIHWNIDGAVDSWCGKAFAVFGMPLIMTALHLLAVLVTLSDPKKQNHSEKIIALIFWIVPALSVLLSVIMYASAIGNQVEVFGIVSVALGLMFAVIGNYMPKCKQNYTVGIKIPWTLNSEENWNRTHRLAGWMWVVGGVAMMLAGFFSLIWVILLVCPVIAIVPVVYSYILHRKGI